MDLFPNKIWEVEREPDFLKLTFHGKYTEGLKTLTWVLVGFEILLLIFMIMVIATLGESIFFIIVLLVAMVIIGVIIWLNDKTRREKHFVIIENDVITLVKTNGKKTISKKLDLIDVKSIKLTNPRQLSDLENILLLLLTGLIVWLLVGAKNDPNPAVYTETDYFPFFEFGRLNEKMAVLTFINEYLSKKPEA